MRTPLLTFLLTVQAASTLTSGHTHRRVNSGLKTQHFAQSSSEWDTLPRRSFQSENFQNRSGVTIDVVGGAIQIFTVLSWLHVARH